MKKQPKTAKRRKWGSAKSRLTTPDTKQASAIGLYLTGTKKRAISRELGLDRETVTRILSQRETQLLVQGFRSAVLKIVPHALVRAYELVRRLHPQTINNVLHGCRVLVDRHEVSIEEHHVRPITGYLKVEFYGKHKRWPTDEELKEFEETIEVVPLTNTGKLIT
jgi:hypothetical protein